MSEVVGKAGASVAYRHWDREKIYHRGHGGAQRITEGIGLKLLRNPSKVKLVVRSAENLVTESQHR